MANIANTPDSEYSSGRLAPTQVTESKDTYNSMPMKCDWSERNLGTDIKYAEDTCLFGGAV